MGGAASRYGMEERLGLASNTLWPITLKAQDMAEVGVTMHAWEYRMKWYGEDEKTAKARAQALNKNAAS